NHNSAGGSDFFVAKYSGANGAHVWSRVIGGTGSDVSKSVVADPSGNVYITGGFNGTVDFGGASITAPQATGIFLAKYSADGTQLLWAKGLGGNFYAQDVGYGVATDASGNVGIIGTVEGNYIDFGGGAL